MPRRRCSVPFAATGGLWHRHRDPGTPTTMLDPDGSRTRAHSASTNRNPVPLVVTVRRAVHLLGPYVILFSCAPTFIDGCLFPPISPSAAMRPGRTLLPTSSARRSARMTVAPASPGPARAVSAGCSSPAFFVASGVKPLRLSSLLYTVRSSRRRCATTRLVVDSRGSRRCARRLVLCGWPRTRAPRAAARGRAACRGVSPRTSIRRASPTASADSAMGAVRPPPLQPLMVWWAWRATRA